mmetsp:Transcript_6413/g.11690  ORF Transcript_6413/g.11690 Transcript_6413/m.11690 type:complete len:215 (+) Transcript_6413:269-913(+)
MNIKFSIRTYIIANDKTNLLHINTTTPQVCCNKHSGRSRSKLLHDLISSCLVHISVNGRDGKVRLLHFLRQPIHFLFSVTENDCLRNGERIVQVTQCIKFPFFLFNINVKLLNSLQCQFISFDENLNWIIHKFACHFQYSPRQGRTHEYYLCCWWEVSVNVINLFLESSSKHLISFVQNHDFEMCRTHCISPNQVIDSTRCSTHHLDIAMFKLF